jgi:arylsulfatase A-like enzyme
MKIRGKRPNILLFMVDQQRYPAVYDNTETALFLKKNLKAQEAFRSCGIEFHRHYAGSTACTPSRATLFTGQYPSLHGVSQTSGAAKTSYDPTMFWLDPNTIPTMGDYFRAGGYRTFYKGKWHVSHSDITVSGTHNSILTCDDAGTPIPEAIDLYRNANRMDGYGFDGWIGPEPHGPKLANSGTRRDPMYADETIDVLKALDREAKKSAGSTQPWLLVNSFVNPHDIVLFGLAWRGFQQNFDLPYTRGWVPNIPPPPTEKEDLKTKPVCQSSYREVYPKALTPQPTTEIYRQFYYYLQKEVDHHISRVYRTLQNSCFFEDTIVVFTADHGELLGAHGGLHQKWHNVYEESVHVPLIFSNPVLYKEPKSATMLTSHVDLIPTMLGLAEINEEKARRAINKDHSEVRPLVGRNLAPVVIGKSDPHVSEPLYFMTDDEITKGLDQFSPVTGKPYTCVIQPNHVESVIAVLPTGQGGAGELWKYSRYFDNPQFWTKPFEYNVVEEDGKLYEYSRPVPAEYEMYNVTQEPLERVNLTHASNRSRDLGKVEKKLEKMLHEQREKKRIYPAPLVPYAKLIRAGG